MKTKTIWIVAAIAALAVAGCKKKDADGQSGTSAGSGSGTAGTESGGSSPTAATPSAKAPEGCNSDLSQAIEADYTLTEKCSPYTASSDFAVDGYTLTIEPGVVIRFGDNVGMVASYTKPGRIVAKGTPEKPVRLVGVRDAPGAWRGLRLYADASGSSFDNVVIENAGSDDAAALTVEPPDVAVRGLTIKGAKKTALTILAEKPLKAFSGLDLREAGGDPDELVHTTFAGAHSLGADGQYPEKAIVLLSGSAAQDLTLPALSARYRILEELHVQPPAGKSAILTIEAGATLEFAEEAALFFGYSESGAGLKVLGSAEKPVTFTRFGEDKQATPFRGLGFWSGSRAPEISYAIIEYAGRAENGALEFHDPKGLGKLTHSIVRHTPGPAIKVYESKERFQAFDANTFEDIGGAALELPAELAQGLGTQNKFGEKGWIKLEGSVQRDTTLADVGVPYHFEGEIQLHSRDESKSMTFKLEPGVTLKFNDLGALQVAYAGLGKLVAKGTAEKPVTLTSSMESWGGVGVYERGSVDLEHVVISNTGEEAYPLQFLAEATSGSVKNVTFKNTKKGLRNCGKATTSDVKADPGITAQEKCE